MSKEFYNKVFGLLKVNGVMTINTCNVHPSYLSQIKTIYDVFGDNIGCLNGASNEISTMLFVTKSNIELMKIEHIKCHFFVMNPTKLIITDEIKNSKIFSLNSMF